MFLALLLLALLAAPALAQEGPPPRHVAARLIAETTGVVPGQTVTLGLREIIEPGWHTYWANPGDAGEPTRLDWRLPPGFGPGPLMWPAPKRLPAGPYMNFGYETRVLLLTAVAVPKDVEPGTKVTLAAEASWQVCSDICVPESARVSVTLPVLAQGPAPIDPIFASDFQMARAALPHPYDGRATFHAEGGRLHLVLAGAAMPSGIAGAAFFPLSPGSLRNAAPQRFAVEKDAVALTLSAGRAFEKTPPATLPGVVVLEVAGGRSAFTIDAVPQTPLQAVSASLGWPLAFLFALLGGLILNLMPCVFPVLSMKALFFARQAERERALLRREGLAYGAGVVLSFLSIGGLLLALRQGGLALGWGFQFQSPLAVALMALLFLVIALNLAGIFEVSFLQNLGGMSGGAFLTGVLAVLVASPCTAPFMAAALGAALTRPPAFALSIFAGLGVGMAMPLVLLSEIPALARLLPKPGAWMARLKLILALPMAATALWLGWVLGQEIGARGAGLLVLAGAGLTLAAWSTGRWQRGKPGRIGVAAGGLIAIFAGLLIVQSPVRTAPETAALRGNGPPSEPFSATRLSALLAAGRPVFVDVTAAWCITCKVNEAVALSDSAVADAFRSRGVVYLSGDWTNGNPELSRLLMDYGRDGVPLSLFFAPGAERAQILPQILTPKIVVDAVSGTPALPRS